MSGMDDYPWTKEMTTKFKDRYVLAEGYPRLAGLDNDLVLIETGKEFADRADIKFPKELLSFNIPKYRLVLERAE